MFSWKAICTFKCNQSVLGMNSLALFFSGFSEIQQCNYVDCTARVDVDFRTSVLEEDPANGLMRIRGWIPVATTHEYDTLKDLY